MADTRTPEQRRRIMQAVGTRNTGAEMAVRRLLHCLGYRFRVNAKSLPGSPDILFTKRRRAIMVHGCFWHGHGCKKGKAPKSRLDYWNHKIENNRARDRRAEVSLRKLGWDVEIIWECETRDTAALEKRLITFLGPSKIDRL